MASNDVPFMIYVRPVRANAQTAPVLAARLVKAAPEDIHPEGKKALRGVTTRASEVSGVQSERDRLAPAKLRPVLLLYLNAWSGLFGALSATGRLGEELGDRGRRARMLEGSLFPDGLSFTQLEADQAWSEGQRRIDRMRAEDLEGDLEELAGKVFITAVKKATAELADAIGTGDSPRPIPSSTGLSDALTRFGRAVGNYGRVMAAACDEEDPESVERFLKAMAPLDAHRANTRGNGGSDPAVDADEPSEPSEPVVEPVEPTDPEIDEPTPTPPAPPVPVA